MPETVAIDRAEIRSEDPAQADAAMAARFAGYRLQGRQDDRPFRFRLSRVDAGELRADYLQHSMTAAVGMGRLDHFMVGMMHSGSVLARTFGDEVSLEKGDCWVLPAGREPSCWWHDFSRTAVHVPLDAVEQVTEQLGARPGSVWFDGMKPVSAAMNRHWTRLTRYVVGQLSDPDTAAVSRLFAAELTRLLATSLLVVFPNSTMTTAYVPGPHALAPAAVRRAMEFVEANAARPITTGDIAREARVSARALQAAFRRELELTPQQYVRRIRLEAAYRELVGADPSDGFSVRAVAARWGFANPSRFARMYYNRFGVLPSQSLNS
jgi:AraC-like DNA-binding protein